MDEREFRKKESVAHHSESDNKWGDVAQLGQLFHVGETLGAAL
jgi:hypothetical protein